MRDLEAIKKRITAELFKRMALGDFFFITDLEKVEQVLGVKLSNHELYPLLRLAHCFKWSELDAETKEDLADIITEVTGITFPIELTEKQK